jgi:hypothetical protein
MWVWSGFVLSLGLAGVAWWRWRAPVQSYYEGEVYGMSAAGHRRYALGFTAATAAFLSELLWPGWTNDVGLPGPPGWHVQAWLAVVTLTAILYGATFVRGATGEDE